MGLFDSDDVMIKEELRKELDQLKAENEKLKQTLTEIREIAEPPYSIPCGGECIYPECEDDLTDNGKYCMELKFKRILQKISECEVTNER